MKEKIKELRMRHKLSQTDFAEICNVTRQTVAKWERGITTPKTDALACICRHFGVDMNYFMSEIPVVRDTGMTGEDGPLFQRLHAESAVAEDMSAYEPYAGKGGLAAVLMRIDCSVVFLTHLVVSLLFAGLLVAFASFLCLSVMAGVSVFSTNIGNVTVNNYNYDGAYFAMFLLLMLLSLAALIFLTVVTGRWRKRIAAGYGAEDGKNAI